jgi:hypothetical protein
VAEIADRHGPGGLIALVTYPLAVRSGRFDRGALG